jgi:glutamate dehydrogenase (NAD(P)+)
MAVSKSLSSLANVTAEFDAAARHLKLDDDLIAFIKEPRVSLKLKLPVQMDAGKIKIFKAYHTIHSIMCGPAIGGV